MNELDEILLDQLHSAQRRQKLIKRLKKILKDGHDLGRVEHQNNLTMHYLKSMIKDKSLLEKKHKKKRKEESDILTKNPVYEWYKYTFLVTKFSYKMIAESFQEYMSFFSNNKKGKE